MLTDQEILALSEAAGAIWEEYQVGRDPAEWKGKTVGVDTDTREVFFGGRTSDIPKRPTVVIVQISRVDAEIRRWRLRGRWRRIYPSADSPPTADIPSIVETRSRSREVTP